jgi:hypothetical protein
MLLYSLFFSFFFFFSEKKPQLMVLGKRRAYNETSMIIMQFINNEIYHPVISKMRSVRLDGIFSPNASMPTTTPVIIDATEVHVDTTIALPCFSPLVCIQKEKEKSYQEF